MGQCEILTEIGTSSHEFQRNEHTGDEQTNAFVGGTKSSVGQKDLLQPGTFASINAIDVNAIAVNAIAIVNAIADLVMYQGVCFSRRVILYLQW